MITKLLIANRGESACRVARTCRSLGIVPATIHSSIDRMARHVREIGESIEVGGPAAAASYLNIEAILAAADAVDADAIHPGIGFLSEDPAFARAVEDAGLVFVGPRPETLEHFADKAAAKRAARSIGIPVIEGSEAGSADARELIEICSGTPLPFLLKATAGGGGRGIRVVRRREGLDEVIASAMREATAAFGRPDLLVERYLESARHIEVQIAGDGDGGTIHLFERECSLQRRHQKIVEEAPAPGLAPELRQAILQAACGLGVHGAFRGVGTVEFLVSGNDYRFLEMNPRLQVEHPVTEMITGLDLVELQLRIAAGEGLPLSQSDVTSSGSAIEARVYAEDAGDGFRPSAGVVRSIEFPDQGIRVDCGVAAGDAITPHYDPMIAKLVAHGSDRAEALARLRSALPGVSILGVETNLRFLAALLADPSVLEGEYDNGLIDREIASLTRTGLVPSTLAFAVAGCLRLLRYRNGAASDPWTSVNGFTGWRLGRAEVRPSRKPCLTVEIGDEVREFAISAIDREGHLSARTGDEEARLKVTALGDDRYHVSSGRTVTLVRAVLDGETVYLDGPFGPLTARVRPYVEQTAASRSVDVGRLLAPVMGQITKIHVNVGDRVSSGDILVVQESMKMELRLESPCDGVVAELACAEGDMIERHGFLAEVRPESAPPLPV